MITNNHCFKSYLVKTVIHVINNNLPQGSSLDLLICYFINVIDKQFNSYASDSMFLHYDNDGNVLIRKDNGRLNHN